MIPQNAPHIGKWSSLEDSLLLQGVQEYRNRWTVIAKRVVKTRSASQCSSRWLRVWSTQEDADHEEGYRVPGNRWSLVSNHFVPTRVADQSKQRRKARHPKFIGGYPRASQAAPNKNSSRLSKAFEQSSKPNEVGWGSTCELECGSPKESDEGSIGLSIISCDGDGSDTISTRTEEVACYDACELERDSTGESDDFFIGSPMTYHSNDGLDNISREERTRVDDLSPFEDLDSGARHRGRLAKDLQPSVPQYRACGAGAYHAQDVSPKQSSEADEGVGSSLEISTSLVNHFNGVSEDIHNPTATLSTHPRWARRRLMRAGVFDRASSILSDCDEDVNTALFRKFGATDNCLTIIAS
ncbi:hypothetical protein PM082_000076 [Marasmius tenuissimus]|nr:hypothetical protein PM082_000076 [Marasmius tenuissimus]